MNSPGLLDIVVWSILLHLICREVRRRTDGKVKISADEIIFNFGSAHVYDANLEAAKILLKRRSKFPEEPQLRINSNLSLAAIWERPDEDGWKAADLKIQGYKKEYCKHPGAELSKAMTDMQARQ